MSCKNSHFSVCFSEGDACSLLKSRSKKVVVLVPSSFSGNQAFVCIYITYGKSRCETHSHTHFSPPLLYLLYSLFKRLLTSYGAALGSAARVCALKQHKHPDTLFITAMSIELQSGPSWWAQSWWSRWRPVYFPGNIMPWWLILVFW